MILLTSIHIQTQTHKFISKCPYLFDRLFLFVHCCYVHISDSFSQFIVKLRAISRRKTHAETLTFLKIIFFFVFFAPKEQWPNICSVSARFSSPFVRFWQWIREFITENYDNIAKSSHFFFLSQVICISPPPEFRLVLFIFAKTFVFSISIRSFSSFSTCFLLLLCLYFHWCLRKAKHINIQFLFTLIRV